jgi:hypothetical protein
MQIVITYENTRGSCVGPTAFRHLMAFGTKPFFGGGGGHRLVAHHVLFPLFFLKKKTALEPQTQNEVMPSPLPLLPSSPFSPTSPTSSPTEGKCSGLPSWRMYEPGKLVMWCGALIMLNECGGEMGDV